MQEWEWSERYPEQPEILRYLEHVAKRHDLKRDIQFNTRVSSAEFDEMANLWRVRTDKGDKVTARYLIAAVGILSYTNMPKFRGLEKFKGRWYHTSRFPHTGVDFTAKRAAVVGTGATAVQAIPEIAQQAKQLTVFQRTANYCAPARNGKVDPELVKARKADYDGIIKRLRESMFGLEHYFIPKSALEATAEEREREFDRMWHAGGFGFWLANYQDMFFDQAANDLCADYIKRKIRKTVKDPLVAEKLIPTGHAYGTKRQPLDSNYYETFNKDNALLVDAKIDGAIEEITEKGIRAGGKEYEFDIIVFATGFDPFTGALKALNLKGAAVVRWTSNGPMVRVPTLASRSPASPTCSPSPARRARQPSPTCRYLSSSTSNGSPTASTTCASPVGPPSRRRRKRRSSGSPMSTRSSTRRYFPAPTPGT